MRITSKQAVLFLFALGALSMPSCKDEYINSKERTGLLLSAGIKTRAVDAAWFAGDRVGLTALESETDQILDQQLNCKYITPQGEGDFYASDESQTIYYPLNGKKLDLIGYYPYSDKVGEDLIYPVNVSNQENRPAIDLMTFDRFVGASKSKPNVEVTFKHRLTKLLFNFRHEEGRQDSPVSKLVIDGMKSAGEYKLLTDELTIDDKSVHSLEVPVAEMKATAIVLPREAGEGISFTITLENGTEYVVNLHGEQELKPGYKYIFNVLLRDKETSPYIKATIQDWEDGGSMEFESKAVVIEQDPGQTIGFKTNDVITLFHEEEEIGVFTYNGSKWIADYPLYWESIGDGVSEKLSIRALFTRDGALHETQMPEYFLAEQEVTRFESISLHFTLVPTKIVFELRSEGDRKEIFSAAELEKATIKLPGYLIGYSMKKGVFTTDETRGDVVVVKNSALLIPQQKRETLAVITVNGIDYAISSDKELDFKKGMVYTFKVNVLKTQATSFNITMTDWEHAQDIEIQARVTIEEGTGVTTGFEDGDQITLYHEKEELATYTYHKGTGSWSSATPLYWENIGDGVSETVKLKAMFKRRDALNETQMPEVMLAEQEATRFRSLHLHFTLMPAKLIFELHSDGTFTDEELKTKTEIELRDYIGDYTLEYGTFTKGTEANSTVKTESFVALIVPQQSSDELAVITLNGNEYVIKKEGGILFEAGVAYTIKVLVSKLKVDFMSMSYTDWVDDEGGVITIGATPVKLIVPNTTTTDFQPNDRITLYHENTTLTSYTYQGGKWVPDSPIYWENIGDGVSDEIPLRAEFIRASALDDSQLPEVMLAAATAKRFQGVSLHFELVPSKLQFLLSSTSNDANQRFTDAELSQATIYLPGYSTGYSLVNGQFIPGNTTGDIAVVNRTALIIPQTKSGVLAIISLKGNSYEVKKDQAIEFVKGKVYTFNVNLLKSQIASFHLSYTDWVPGGNYDTDATPVNLQQATGTTENFTDGDRITIYYEQTELTSYTYHATGNKWTPDAPLYWENIGDGNSEKVQLRAMFKRTDALNNTQMPEVMLAEQEATRFHPLSLHFNLVPAKVVFELHSDGTFTDQELKSTEIELRKYIGEYTLEYGTFTAGTAANSTIDVANFTALIVPQQSPDELAILSINGNDYRVTKSGGILFEAGKAYTIKVNLNKWDVHFMEMSYTDWVAAEGGIITINASPVNLDISVGTTTNFKSGDAITLYHETTKLATYTYNGTAWTPDAPLYWENIGDGISSTVELRASFQRADALHDSQLPEVMLASTTATRFQGVSLHFTLTPAKVLFVLKSESDDLTQCFSVTELNGATIALPGYLNDYTLSNGIYTPGTGTGTITVVNKTALIMPQSKNGVIAEITIAGNRYSVNKQSAITFNDGEVTTITVNILKSRVSSVTASYTEWEPGEEESFTVFVVKNPGSSSNFVEGNQMSLYYDNASAVKTQIGDFTYNGTTGWTTNPIAYWENLDALEKYNFYATSTLSKAAADSNQMDDVMYAEKTNVARFGNVELAFTKRTTRIVVILSSTDGSFTTDELKTATITLPDYTYGAAYSGIEYTAGSNTGTITATAASAERTWVALIEPQTIAANETLINIQIAGVNYPLKKTAATTFDIATTYTYKINLSKSDMSFTTSYSDWSEGYKEEVNVSMED